MTQKDFPRGGKKPLITPASKSLLFERNNPIKARKDRAKKSSKKSHEEDTLVASTAQSLTYSTLCEGMVVLGRVQDVSDYDLIVSLPGRLSGRVKVTDIGEAYTNLLESVVTSDGETLSEFKPLTDLYSRGDYVVTYVKALGEDERWRVTLSLESNLVNQNLSAGTITNRSKIVCSVSSVEDHGYVIETGIPNVRAFLLKKDVEDDSKYFPGKQIMCAVKNIKSQDSASIVNLSAKEKHLLAVSEEIKSLDNLLPGTKLILSIQSVLSNGLQVMFNGDRIGYINQTHLHKPLTYYKPGLEVDGTLLYIIPTVKFAYFSLLPQNSEKSSLSKEDVVNGRVLSHESNGLLLKIERGIRGFIPYRRTDVDFKKINKIFAPGSEHKCRVLAYDGMDRVYICSTEKAVLNKKYLGRESFIHGEIVDVTIKEINRESGFVTVSIENITGTVTPEHTSDTGVLTNNLKIGQIVKAKVLSSSEKCVKFTLKSALIDSTLPVLDDIQKAKVGSVLHGTIRQITEKGILVKFFGELGGWVPTSFLDSRLKKRKWNHFIGEVVTVEIKSVNLPQNRMTLKIMKKKSKKANFKVGEPVSGVVIDSSVDGIQVQITKNDSEKVGFLPAGHIAPCPELGSLIATRTLPGDEISVLVFSTFPNLILSDSFIPREEDTSLDKLKVGSSILCSVKEIVNDTLKMTLPVNNFFGYATVKKVSSENVNLIRRNQILLTKIKSINGSKKEVGLTINIADMHIKSTELIMSAIDALAIYLLKIKSLSEKAYFKDKPISSVVLGDKVEGVVEKITEHGLVLKLKDNLRATVRKDHYKGDVKVGDKVKGVVLWVNFIYELLEVSLLPQLVSSISKKQIKLKSLPLETKLRGTIVLITNWFILVVLKGELHGGFVVMPTRLHMNDMNPDLSSYYIGQKVRCFVVLNDVEFNWLNICLPKSAFELKMTKLYVVKKQNMMQRYEKVALEIKEEDRVKEDKKRKMEDGEVQVVKKKKKIPQEEIKEEEISEEEKKEREEMSEEEEQESEETPEDEDCLIKDEKTELTIPECGFYWDPLPSYDLEKEKSSSSESEGETEDQPKQKKKKLSAAERREQERQKEKEIRDREEALASADHMPKSVDQFDRLVLGSPDSSLIWLQYMAYHLQATEVDKARKVAERAIKTINCREENERLNVWQALLNLETKFGTSDTLQQAFQEAVRVNDAAKIHSHMLTTYSEAGKVNEMEKIVQMIIRKFKDQPEMWIKCGEALLKVGLKEKSRHIMQRALQSLRPHEHVNLIARFALLENTYGDKERSQTLFEQILNTYPKRTDIWSTYVDSLIKSSDIDIARSVLKRSVTTLVLPPRKMKVLFKKFIDFEEKYGTKEAVAHVREMTNEYVNKKCTT